MPGKKKFTDDSGSYDDNPQYEYSTADFVNRNAKMDQWRDIHWIYENMDMPDVGPYDAPSAGAYAWLLEIRGDQTGESRRKFRDYYMKLAPSGKDLAEREKLADDGRNVLELIGAVERAMGIDGGGR